MTKSNLENTIDGINKQYGAGAVFRLGDSNALKVEAISTGVPSLDRATGIGGIPRGRVTEIFGPESGGKTTLTLHVIAEAQKIGGQAGFIDAEHALDPIYAKAVGVDTDDLVISQPDCGEQALEIAESFIRSGEFDVVVVDSVAALVPKAELEGDMGDPQMGLQARLMSQALRKLTAVVSKSKTSLIFINQLRDRLNVLFGSPETTTGGKALRFYSSLRLDVRKTGAIKEGDKAIGNRVRIRTTKNKMFAPFKEVEIDLMFGEGFSKEGDVVDLGVNCGIIEKAGSWLSYKGEHIGQGREKAKTFLRGNSSVLESILEDLTKVVG